MRNVMERPVPPVSTEGGGTAGNLDVAQSPLQGEYNPRAIVSITEGCKTSQERFDQLVLAGVLGLDSSLLDAELLVMQAQQDTARLAGESGPLVESQADSTQSSTSATPVSSASTPPAAPTPPATPPAAPTSPAFRQQPTPPTPPTPASPEDLSDQISRVSNHDLTVVTVGASVDLRQAAIDFAEQRLTNELNSGGRFKRFISSIWKGNIAKSYYRARYAREAEQAFVASGNFVGGVATAEELAAARRALFDRFSLSYDEAIHQGAGESREAMAGDSVFVQRSKELIRRYVESEDGAFNKASLMEEINHLLKESAEGENPVLKGAELIAVSNLSEIADAVKAQVAHGHALEQVLESMKFVSGEARSGVRTDLEETSVEKLAKKLSKNKWARLLGPNALLAVATTVGSIAGIGSRRLVGAALAWTLVPGGAGGLWAAWRERLRTDEDRIQHARERAQGLEVAAGSKRREQMEGVVYQTEKATDLRDALQEVRERLLNNSLEESERHKAIQEALEGLASVNTRIRIGDSRGADLISFSSSALIGQERMELDIARAELRAELDRVLGGLSAEERTSIGLGEGNAAALIDGLAQQYEEVLTNDMTAKDAAFRKLRRWRMAKAGVAGAVSGITLGLVSQEVIAMLMPNTVQGLFSGRRGDSAGRQTLLRGLLYGKRGVDASSIYEGNIEQRPLANGGTVTAPDSLSFRDDGNGVFSIHNTEGNVVLEGIRVDDQGRIEPESMELLKDKGFTVTETPRTSLIDGESIREVVTYDKPGDYVKDHGGVEISKRSWADNNTKRFDENELRLWETGVAEDGTIKASVAAMTKDGSYGQGPAVNWHEAQAEGRLVALVTASRGTQNFAFEIPIGPDGKFVIPPDHPAHKLFDVESGKEWKAGQNFNGAYIEVAQKTVGEDGRIHAHMLATDVGRNNVGPITTETIVRGEPQEVTVYDYTIVPPASSGEGLTDMAPVLPVTNRRSLENMVRPIQGEAPSSYHKRLWDRELVDRRRSETSPRLLDDPGASLRDTGLELQYFSEQLHEYDPERVERIREIVADNEILNNLPTNLKGIVAIPVAAVHEAGNIHHTLERLAGQREGLEETVVAINLNWIQGALQDPAQQREIDRTRREIERARQDFPQLKIAVIENEYSSEAIQQTNGAIGYVMKDLYDTVLVAADSAVQRGRIADPRNLVIVRADADTVRMSPKYLGNIYEAVRNRPGTDVFQGATRHGIQTARNMPGFSILTNFDAALAAADARRGRAYLGNHNYAIRAGTFAAIGGIGIAQPAYTGVGSDGLEIAARLQQARAVGAAAGYATAYGISDEDSTISAHVGGAQIESLASRFLPAYMDGQPLDAAWGGFDGEGGYAPRDSNSRFRGGRESVERSIERLEKGLSYLLRSSRSHPDDIRRILTLFFQTGLGLEAPGYDTAILAPGSAAEFKFTDEGREALRQRLQRSGGASLYEQLATRTGNLMV